MTDRSGLATLLADTLALSIAANAVITVRLTKMAFGGVDFKREGNLMVSEKIDAATEATFAAARAVAMGQGHHAAARAVAVYKHRVDRNLQRLTGD
jgi:hypothetical protein